MEKWTLDQTFIGNDADGTLVTWRTDASTLFLLRQYGDGKDRFSSSETMLGFIFHAGRAAGRIVRDEGEVKEYTCCGQPYNEEYGQYCPRCS